MTNKEVQAVIEEIEHHSDMMGYPASLGYNGAAKILRAALHKSQLAAIERKTARRIRALDTLPSRKLS